MKRSVFTHIIAGCLLVLAAAACKKETEYEQYPFNNISSFSVTAGDEPLTAAIQGDSIILYWPSYIALPATIAPTITPGEKATVSPASGTAVPLATGTKFTVTAEDGTSKDYFLKLVINEPPIQIYDQAYSTTKGGSITVELGRTMRYFAHDAAITSFFIVDAEDHETQLPIEFILTNPSIPKMKITVPDEEGIREGAYRIKIVSGHQVKLTENALFGILYPSNRLPKANALTGDITVKRGETITVTGTGFFDIQGLRAYKLDANWNEVDVATFELVSFTATSATFRVPASFTAGNYQYGDYNGANPIFFSIRVSDFFSGWNWTGAKKRYVAIGGTVGLTVTD